MLGHFSVLFALLLPSAQAGGRFELKLVKAKVPREELSNGVCCDGARVQGVCRDRCDVFVRVCLKDFLHDSGSLRVGGSRAPLDPQECLGFSASPLLLRNEPSQAVVSIDFNYPWTRSFTLVIDLMDSDNDTKGHDELIDRMVFSSALVPDSDQWRQLPLQNGRGVQYLETQVRLSCNEHFHGVHCTRFCDARNDSGRFTCDNLTGDKKCAFGWTGEDCNVPVCRAGCQHGSCLEPGRCDCAPGWEGSLCEKCVRYPGCVHGSCASPFQCTCEAGWGGLLCDRDMSMCERHRPCKNGASCRNVEDNYMCECPPNYEGVNCTEPKQSCKCENGGTCLLGSTYECRCQPGFSGPTCANNVDECSPNPCERGGRCTDLVNGFRCECPSGWIGPRCNINLQKCLSQKDGCLELTRCTSNTYGDYECECRGSECSNSSILCRGQCKNGGTCQETVSGVKCSCPVGFSGEFCESPLDHCASQSCNQHGKCTSTANGPQCACDAGHEGEFCELDTDRCDPNPCRNGATCYDMGDDFYCSCAHGFQGKQCLERSRRCDGRNCASVDFCLMAVSVVNISADSAAAQLALVPTNVCGAHGTCFNKDDGGFFCACSKGYRGTYCQENINDCDSQKCMNGGTCIDGANTFQCICPVGYEGRYCERSNDQCCQSRNTSCSTKPCKNGGTCVSVGASHTCICRDGFAGSDCSVNINECNTSPCFNGAQCQDGVNFRECICPSGYIGHDCRININECEQNPCTYGSECIDTAGSYMCKCPPNREGRHCEKAIGRARPPSCAILNGRRLEHGEWFEESCRNCTCEHGELACRSVPCVPANCSLTGAGCPSGQQCVVLNSGTCFSAPCVPHGVCKSRSEQAELEAVRYNDACLPNQRDSAPGCVKMLLAFDKSKLPRGVSVRTLCDEIVLLQVTQTLAAQASLAIACAISNAASSVIEVAVSAVNLGSSARNARASTLTASLSGLSNSELFSSGSFAEFAALTIARQIGHRYTNSSLLAAVTDIRVETPAAPLLLTSGLNATVVVVMCAVVVAFGVLAVLALVIHHRRAMAKLAFVGYSDLPNNLRYSSSTCKAEQIRQPLTARQVSSESKSDRMLPPIPHNRQISTGSNPPQAKSTYLSKRVNDFSQA